MPFPSDVPIIDLGIGFPYSSVEEKKAAYAFMRPLYKDPETLREMEFPAEYMFKDAPDVVAEGVDPIEFTIKEMDKYGIERAMTGLSEQGVEASKRYPGRFFFTLEIQPNEGMECLRKMEAAKADYDIKAIGCFPSGQMPQVPINDPKMYPIYLKCVELDLPVFINAGVVGPRMPSYPQHVEHLDIVCYDFPELRIVTRHGTEPWEKLAWKLMLKWPNLHYCTSAFAPKHYPKEIINFANTRGADKLLYCGYFPAGLSIERQLREFKDVPFRDHVWPKFLRENAIRVLNL